MSEEGDAEQQGQPQVQDKQQQDMEAKALHGSGLVAHLTARWETGELARPGEDLPPVSAFVAARGGRALGVRGAAAARAPGASPQLLLQILQESDPEEALEQFSVEEREPGPEPRSSLVQFVTAKARIRGDLQLVFKSSQCPALAALAQKEGGLYQHVLPRMADLWPDEAFDIFPACLHSAPDVVVLQDARAAGWRPAPEGRQLDSAHCAALLAALARFHAGSLAYKRASAAEAAAALAEAGRDPAGAELQQKLKAEGQRAAELLRRHARAGKHADAVKALLSRGAERLQLLRQASEPSAVLVHGDPRGANVLFRYEDEDGGQDEDPAPAAALLLDLRSCRYASPALDVATVLWGGVAEAGAREDMDALLRGYHRALARALRSALGGPHQPPFSLVELRREVQRHAPYALLAVDLPVRPPKPEDAEEPEAEADPEEAERLAELVLALADAGALD